MPVLAHTHAQVFTCTATPTPTQPWLIHRTSTPRYRPGLNAYVTPFIPGAKRHVTNFERLHRMAGEVQMIEWNIEMGNWNVELERVVRKLDAQLRGLEDFVLSDV